MAHHTIYTKATLVLEYRAAQGDFLLQMVIWRPPRRTRDRPHGIKYRLYLGRAGRCLVRYDNETGKGDHRHLGDEKPHVAYEFTSVDALLEDFRADCEQLGWRWSK